MHSRWEPLSIQEVAERFRPFPIDWWIAGGLAIDLFLGWQTRPHADIDVEMFRNDREVLFDVFDGWELFTVSDGELLRWERSEAISPNVFGVWGRPGRDAPWAVEVMLADGDRKRWRFRRDPAISLAGDQLVRRSIDGIPYCTPEVQLLYKSKQSRPKDDVDLARTLFHMTRAQRRWLADAIRSSDAAHPWIDVLEMADARHHD